MTIIVVIFQTAEGVVRRSCKSSLVQIKDQERNLLNCSGREN